MREKDKQTKIWVRNQNECDIWLAWIEWTFLYAWVCVWQTDRQTDKESGDNETNVLFQKEKYNFRQFLVWFYSTSTIVGYLMPNPFLYITVLLQTEQFMDQSPGAVEYTDWISADGLSPSCSKCPEYDIKTSDSAVLVMLELWGMLSTPSLLSLPGPLWLRIVAPDRALSMGQIELSIVLMLTWTVWNRTIFTSKLYHAKRNCLKENCFDIWLCINKSYTYTKLNCLN